MSGYIRRGFFAGRHKTPVEFLAVLLPMLESIQRNVNIIADVNHNYFEQEDAAREVVWDLCACYRTFEALDLPDVIGTDKKIVINQVADTAWLIDAGRKVNEALLEHGVDWPPSDEDPPGITCDLLRMYGQAIKAKSEHEVLSSQRLRDSLAAVGYTACELAQNWPKALVGTHVIGQVEKFGRSSSKLFLALGVVAALAEALTVFGALSEVGPDLAKLINNLATIAQAIGGDVANLGQVVYAQNFQITRDVNDWKKFNEYGPASIQRPQVDRDPRDRPPPQAPSRDDLWDGGLY